MGFTTVDDNVETTVAIGLVTGSEKHDGVYLLKTIYTYKSPTTYDDMVSCTAATMHALRGQYEKIQSDAQAVSPSQNAWETWCELARCLTYTRGKRYILYQINPMNGLPSFVYCQVPSQLNTTFMRGNKKFVKSYMKKLKTGNGLARHRHHTRRFPNTVTFCKQPLQGKLFLALTRP